MCAVAGVLANMLCFPVSLLDIEKWFFKPTSQKTVVHEELTAMLSSRGLTWPPNVQGFQHCSSYKRHLSSGKIRIYSTLLYCSRNICYLISGEPFILHIYPCCVLMHEVCHWSFYQTNLYIYAPYMVHLNCWALRPQASWPLMTMQGLLCCPLLWLIWAQARQKLMILLWACSTSFLKVDYHNIETQQSFVHVVGGHLWLFQQLI